MSARLELPAEHAHVALVTIDRPEKANSLDPVTLAELAAAWRRAAEDADVRCVVVTGAGERVFCSGMDVKLTIAAAQALAQGERVSEEEFEGLRSVSTALLAGFDLGKPLISTVNGHSRGGGLDMLLASELRYAVPEATFALEEVGLGLYPTGNSTVLLPRQIGWVHANELLMTAQPIGAEKALRIGLINEIVERAALMDRVFEVADSIAANSPLAVRETRRGLRELWGLSLEEGYRRQEEIGGAVRKSEDAREGQRAFVEKRAPVWSER